MSDQKIRKATVDAAIAAALDALAAEPSLAWIKKSALFERSYYQGLYWGLSAIADDEYLRALLVPILKTMSPRQADDTFYSTTIGRDFASLKTASSDDAQQMVEKLHTNIDEQDRRWQDCVKHTHELLSEIRSLGGDSRSSKTIFDDVRDDARHQKLYQILEHLEHCARRIALLETDHKISKRLET